MRQSFLVLSIAACTLLGCGEDIESRYSNVAELRRAEAGAQSWMPHWLPATAIDIRDWHNLDTNATFIAFNVPKVTQALLAGCQPVGTLRNRREGPAWWPDDLAFAKLQHFKCEERKTFGDGRIEVRETGAAIDHGSNRVYFWRSGG